MTIDFPIKSPRKMIEVALPLDAINEACAREKQPGIGAHPRGLHLWWARRPLAAARAVIFAQLVNDPGTNIGRGFRYGMNKKDAAKERERLFKIISDLVQWGNTGNEIVLEQARVEIRRSWNEVCELNKDHPQATELFNPNILPAFHDPFAGGGALPLEAQRLGLESYASDLNPVAVTINKAMIEIPPKFTGRPPIGPQLKSSKQFRLLDQEWPGASGLAEDVRRYGYWMRNEAQSSIGHLYPKIKVTPEMANDRPDLDQYIGEDLNVITYLWARTVRSPNPAFTNVEVPLVSSFILSSKAGKHAWVKPIVEGKSYKFTVKMGEPIKEATEGTKALGRGSDFKCLVSGTPISGDYIKSEGQAGRMGARLMALVVEGKRSRIYLAPTSKQEECAKKAVADWRPVGDVPARLTGGTCVPYGLKTWGDLFTARQLVTLTTFSELVHKAIDRCYFDAKAAGIADDGIGLDAGGTGALAYAQAIGVYLSFTISRLADYGSTLATWKPSGEQVMQTYKRQALPMTWDFPESNLLGLTAICLEKAIKYTADNLCSTASITSTSKGFSLQEDAQNQNVSFLKVISTDPPYYDNIGYADLSDFFYVWLRKTLRPVFPKLYSSISVPKSEELVATAYRHGGKEKAELFFLNGMKQALHNLAIHSHPAFPITIYYAFKQAETKGDEGTTSTGWVTFLQAVMDVGFSLTGTWPMRTELGNRMISAGNNALASSIVLVCRKRSTEALSISRREFQRELNTALPEALDEMTRGGVNSPVAPVDLSQAIIGPGMAIFSKYSAVLEADGTPMSVKTALQLINRFLAEDDFDHDTQFCLAWFSQYSWDEGKFGEADVLARSKGTSVEGVKNAGVVSAASGIVRLLKSKEYPSDWDPKNDRRLPVWEALHQLIRIFRVDGESAAGRTLAVFIDKTEAIRQLAYRLYTLCERTGRAEDARAYNDLITSWGPIERHANAKVETTGPIQTNIFDTH